MERLAGDSLIQLEIRIQFYSSVMVVLCWTIPWKVILLLLLFSVFVLLLLCVRLFPAAFGYSPSYYHRAYRMRIAVCTGRKTRRDRIFLRNEYTWIVHKTGLHHHHCSKSISAGQFWGVDERTRDEDGL